MKKASCDCKDFVTANGFGNCNKVSSSLGKLSCYVKQPSSCSDLRDSETNPGHQFSAKACEKGILYQFNIQQYILFIIVLYQYLFKNICFDIFRIV